MNLQELTAPIQKNLEEVEQTISQSLRSDNLFVRQMVDHLSHSTGKRIRPALALLSAKFCGKVNRDTVALGAALEMIHVATLIHDDIIDNSLLRRKQKTLNFKWGNEASVLMGDYVFASSFYLMAKFLPKEVISALSDTTNIICRGEISETFHRFNADLTEEEYFTVVREKTASLFAASCQTGAMLAGADAPTVEMLQGFGLGIGMAFQVIDDTLDFTGKQSKVGKPVMSDIREGKLTLPVLHCLKACAAPEKKRIRKIILKRMKTRADIGLLSRLLRKYGSIAYSIQKARDFVAKAQASLRPLNGDRDKNDLLRFSEFLVSRDF